MIINNSIIKSCYLFNIPPYNFTFFVLHIQIRHAQEQVIYALMALVCVEYIRPVQEVQIHVPIATVFAEQMLPVLPLICVLMDNARVRSDFDDSKDNFLT